MQELITIITPTYNREFNLHKLYVSLTQQSNLNFIWMVVDDGSTDNTEEYIKSLMEQKKIKIEYYKKNNGGKHTALNLAFDNIKTDIFAIVDSDDTLTHNAIEIIEQMHKKYKENEVGGFVFLKGFSKKEPVTAMFEQDEFLGNYITDIINKQKGGDRFEVFYTNLIKQTRFPVFNGEKFIGEGFFWCKISKTYNIVFVNKIIYLCEYLENGLTKSGRKLRINNPLGGMYHASEYFEKNYNLKIRIKNTILYMVYFQFAKQQNKTPKKLKNSWIKFICIIPSYIIFFYWSNKYK